MEIQSDQFFYANVWYFFFSFKSFGKFSVKNWYNKY